MPYATIYRTSRTSQMSTSRASVREIDDDN